jgi:hypothetical protein
VALDKEETEIPQDRDIIEVYMAKDSTYLYAGLRLRGTPYAGLFASGEYLNYHIGFNCQRYDRGFNSVPVTIELGGSPTGWKWRLFSYGQDKGIISELGATDCALGDIAEFRIPLTYIRDKINQYEPSNDFPSGQWDGKEIFISTSLWSYMSGAYNSDTTHDGKLAQLN